MEWEAGVDPQPKRVPKACHCSIKPKEKDEIAQTETHETTQTSGPQPSASTSTSSFKTATNDKANSAQTDGGYIKLVDETGQEAGKFFLGTAGFIKDAYEVVIQLRKKNSSRETSPRKDSSQLNQPEPSKDSNTEKVQSFNSDLIDIAASESSDSGTQPLSSEVGINELLAFRNVTQKESTKITPHSTKQPDSSTRGKDNATSTQNTESQTLPVELNQNIRLVQSAEEKKDIAEKETDIQKDHARSELPSRPATTTYTQTTNSPNHRPIYFHMSSSTSTAYMSPPEIILPQFFRRESTTADDGTYAKNSMNTMYNQVDRDKNNRKCKHVRTLNKMNLRLHSGRTHRQDTPDLQGHKISTPCKTSRVDKIKCKCHNCGSHRRSKEDVKKCHRNKNYHGEIYQSSQNLNLFVDRNTSKYNRGKAKSSSTNKKYSGTNLNPIIKTYINKLLALNREGLKAIEVADQECSSVGTPGSSIINVPHNLNERKSVSNKISLEQIKNALKHQIIEEHLNNNVNYTNIPSLYKSMSKNFVSRKPRRKPVHKVKSFNISKRKLQKYKSVEPKPTKTVSLSTTTDDNSKTYASSIVSRSRSRSSPTPRHVQPTRQPAVYKQNFVEKTAAVTTAKKTTTGNVKRNDEKISAKSVSPPLRKEHPKLRPSIPQSHKTTSTDTSQDSVSTKDSHHYYKNKPDIPISMSTQTSQNIESDFMKLAEDKLQNMEKIADLTEKCTKRLSNLAKVLEEVRKNKSLVYSQISASDSTDSQSDKLMKNTVAVDTVDEPDRLEIKSPEPIQEEETVIAAKEKPHSEYISFLTDIPKPAMFQLTEPKHSNLVPLQPTPSPETLDASTSELIKYRPKPPPALSRIHLKHGQEYIVPHELSTVIEVDSPMSVKNKKQSSRNDAANSSNRSSNEDKDSPKDEKTTTKNDKESAVNPDLLQVNSEVPKQAKFLSTESDDPKFQMIDLKHFNEIMLEPFISIHEYAKKYHIHAPDEGSNMEDLQKDDNGNDDLSSLHSDGSLPDVIAELLKRNIITEPFKYDTASNINSTTFSSESTLSMLALSKARKGRKRPSVVFQNKENIAETSDTLSISSNPDLENAFRRLGMGWASSTLKKTKERLALSSSSNTSSSSISQFKIKSFNQDIPALVTDSVSSVLLSKLHSKTVNENSKPAEQQTSFTNSMTVKEFLQNELANKITFTNKSNMNDTEEEFVSLFETKMPDELKQQSLVSRDERERSNDSAGVNRARTSTPVQVFKSMTYHSSSSSNASNGLFSNADDLSSVKMTSNSMKNHSTSDKDDLTIPNFSLKTKKSSDASKSD